MKFVKRKDWWVSAATLLRPAHTVLDVGPGIRPQTLVASKSHICAEPYDEYADILSGEHPECVVLRQTWAEAVESMSSNSVDTIMLLDVIEHLEKADGEALLKKSIEVARSQVVVFTPLGFLPQGEGEAKDAWGLNGVDWQIHRSGWLPDDFEGWKVLVCEDYHVTDAYGRPSAEHGGALFAVLDKGPGKNPGAHVRKQHALMRKRLRDERRRSHPGVFLRAGRKLRRLLCRP